MKVEVAALGCLRDCEAPGKNGRFLIFVVVVVSELRICVKVEVAALGCLRDCQAPSGKKGRFLKIFCCVGAQELCESGGGRSGQFLVPNSPYGRCGRNATLN